MRRRAGERSEPFAPRQSRVDQGGPKYGSRWISHVAIKELQFPTETADQLPMRNRGVLKVNGCGQVTRLCWVASATMPSGLGLLQCNGLLSDTTALRRRFSPPPLSLAIASWVVASVIRSRCTVQFASAVSASRCWRCRLVLRAVNFRRDSFQTQCSALEKTPHSSVAVGVAVFRCRGGLISGITTASR